MLYFFVVVKQNMVSPLSPQSVVATGYRIRRKEVEPKITTPMVEPKSTTPMVEPKSTTPDRECLMDAPAAININTSFSDGLHVSVRREGTTWHICLYPSDKLKKIIHDVWRGNVDNTVVIVEGTMARGSTGDLKIESVVESRGSLQPGGWKQRVFKQIISWPILFDFRNIHVRINGFGTRDTPKTVQIGFTNLKALKGKIIRGKIRGVALWIDKLIQEFGSNKFEISATAEQPQDRNTNQDGCKNQLCDVDHSKAHGFLKVGLGDKIRGDQMQAEQTEPAGVTGGTDADNHKGGTNRVSRGAKKIAQSVALGGQGVLDVGQGVVGVGKGMFAGALSRVRSNNS